jgi:DDE superfamily endonuclease
VALIVRRWEVMMAAVAVASSLKEVDGPAVVRERLEAFGIEVLTGAVNRPVQLVNGGVYLRGLIEDGARKSLEPMVGRLGGEADYESLQQFLAVSTWDPALVVRAVAERRRPSPREPGRARDGTRSRCGAYRRSR